MAGIFREGSACQLAGGSARSEVKARAAPSQGAWSCSSLKRREFAQKSGTCLIQTTRCMLSLQAPIICVPAFLSLPASTVPTLTSSQSFDVIDVFRSWRFRRVLVFVVSAHCHLPTRPVEPDILSAAAMLGDTPASVRTCIMRACSRRSSPTCRRCFLLILNAVVQTGKSLLISAG
ncbi:hypothetical protein SinmeB_6029 (plasmid) [Sinorhizobium meliloti BL225C]|nr:hypothetical protein SinmeB_6029 [Sinorhizobium meliloti BL225C]